MNVNRSRAGWRESSDGAARSGDCVELTAWRKSSYSGANGGQCVEVAGRVPRGVAVRDSKDPGGPALAFTPSAWESFTAGVRNGAFAIR